MLGQLLASPAWKEVVAIGRREAPVPEAYAQYPAGKLQQKVINMDNMEQEAAEAVRGADSVFCALGTTRKAAGSAEKFRRVDLDYVEGAAKLASAAKVPHFSLVSSQGANPNLWASTWSLTHSLYYAKIKGMVSGTMVILFRIVLWWRGRLTQDWCCRTGGKSWGLEPWGFSASTHQTKHANLLSVASHAAMCILLLRPLPTSLSNVPVLLRSCIHFPTFVIRQRRRSRHAASPTPPSSDPGCWTVGPTPAASRRSCSRLFPPSRFLWSPRS